MNPPAAPPAPIHDIIDAVPIFPYPLSVVVPVGLLGLVVLGWLVWFLLLRKRPGVALTARERAIAGLVRLHGEKRTPYEFAVVVSDVLRQYVDEVFGLRATTATSVEFLESIRNSARFTVEEKERLGRFLEVVDLLKFARAEAGGEELEQLFEAAEAVVRKEEVVEGAKA